MRNDGDIVLTTRRSARMRLRPGKGGKGGRSKSEEDFRVGKKRKGKPREGNECFFFCFFVFLGCVGSSLLRAGFL